MGYVPYPSIGRLGDVAVAGLANGADASSDAGAVAGLAELVATDLALEAGSRGSRALVGCLSHHGSGEAGDDTEEEGGLHFE